MLVDADKTSIVIKKKEQVLNRRIDFLSNRLVDNYKGSIDYPKNRINKLREMAYQEVLNTDVLLTRRILSLNLPTGMGKTMLSLSHALRLRYMLFKQKGKLYRVVYALPFLSIIEQNFSEFEKVLKYNRVKVDSNILLKHHHLSDGYYKQEDQEFEGNEAKILIEGWNSEVIVTTFVQFFHTLISCRNTTSRRFHRLSNAIIILDEVQAIPCKYWLVIGKMLSFLVDKLDSYIIFVTATEPIIFDKSLVFPLLDKRKYYQSLDRVVIEPKLDKSQTVAEFVATLNIVREKSYLFILNTINSAKQLYRLLKQMISEDIIFLSSHIIPKQRLERINKMRKKESKVAVTTQLVEAGVDIDFDIVYRDFAPMDSIAQSAGRCNRNWSNRGEVKVVLLKDDSGRSYASYIYDPILLDATKRFLTYEVPEADLYKVIETYYNELAEIKSSDESVDIINAVTGLKFDSYDSSVSIKDFKLIEEDYKKVDVFIELDENAEVIWKEYIRINCIDNLIERKNAFDLIKNEFYQYVISVHSRTMNIPPLVSGFYYVNRASLDDFYNLETGYILEDILSIW